MNKAPTHNFTATYQEGIVSQVDPKTHRIKAIIPDLEDFETAWLPVVVQNAGGNQFYALPDKGELVVLLLDARGERGCMVGTIYNDEDPPPVNDSEMWVKKFRNGTEISHNRATGEVVVKTSGKIVANAQIVEITAPCQIIGDVNIQGNLTASGEISAPTVMASGISLSNHTHIEQGDGKPTSQPK